MQSINAVSGTHRLDHLQYLDVIIAITATVTLQPWPLLRAVVAVVMMLTMLIMQTMPAAMLQTTAGTATTRKPVLLVSAASVSASR